MTHLVRTRQQSIEIYQPAWQVMAMGIFMAIMCFTVASAAYWWMLDETLPSGQTFLVVFCGIFGIVGLLIVAGIPRQMRELQNDEGAVVFRANRDQLFVRSQVGYKGLTVAWSAVELIDFTDTLVAFDSDGKHWRFKQLVITFKSSATENLGFMARIQSTLGRTATRLPYHAISLDPSDVARLFDLLRRMIPNGILMRRGKLIEFNEKTGVDLYFPETRARQSRAAPVERL